MIHEMDTVPVTPQLQRGFSGSYEAKDVTFLLTPVPVKTMTVEEKERFIQAGNGHYSSVLSPEKPADLAYLQLFEKQTVRMSERVAFDICALAQHVDAKVPTGEIALVSLARAGTPVGVLVGRALRKFGRTCAHYSVSIFRDKGLDINALSYILSKHPDTSVVFVDGWTGKGVVGRTLAASVTGYNQAHGTRVSPDLLVLADIAGTAAFSATREDYLLPSAVLNSTVSGLVSRTVLNEFVGPKDFHGCALMHHLAKEDRSRFFVDHIWKDVQRVLAGELLRTQPAAAVDPKLLRLTLRRYMKQYGVTDINLLKPGVGEATRVLLRRKPRLLVVKSLPDPFVEHLIHLAKSNATPFEEDRSLPCRALALISSAD